MLSLPSSSASVEKLGGFQIPRIGSSASTSSHHVSRQARVRLETARGGGISATMAFGGAYGFAGSSSLRMNILRFDGTRGP